MSKTTEREDVILGRFGLPDTAELMEELRSNRTEPETARKKQVKHLLTLASEIRSKEWLVTEHLRSVESSARNAAEDVASAGGEPARDEEEDWSPLDEVGRMQDCLHAINGHTARRDEALNALDLAADVYLAMRGGAD